MILKKFLDYLYKPGLPGGQLAYGGTEARDDITFASTKHATKGDIILGTDPTENTRHIGDVYIRKDQRLYYDAN